MRGGTENVAAIVGFGKACELARDELSIDLVDDIEQMKTEFIKSLSCGISNTMTDDLSWSLNGCSQLATKTMSIRVNGVDAESLVLMADAAGVCISAGSACNSRQNVPSHVLTAIGLKPDQARNSFRVSFSRMNTIEDAKMAGKIIADCVITLRLLEHNVDE